MYRQNVFSHRRLTSALSIQPASVWRLDETTGAVVYDSLGVRNGTHAAGVTVDATGKIQKAASYDNTNDLGYTTFGIVWSKERTDAFSVSLWLGRGSAIVGNPYRTPGREHEAIIERDPFPPIRCFDCRAQTTSMSGEDLCSRCDLKWLLRGIDWFRGA